MYRHCIDCGEPFPVENGQEWKIRCLQCWREWRAEQDDQYDTLIGTMRHELAGLQAECDWLREIIAELEPWAEIGRALADRAHDVLFLVHPDKHGGHPVATEIASWINSEVRR